MGLSLEACLVYVVGHQIGINEGIKLGFSYRKVVGTKFGAVVGFSLGIYVGPEVWSLESSTHGYVDGKFGGLLDQRMDLRSEKWRCWTKITWREVTCDGIEIELWECSNNDTI